MEYFTTPSFQASLERLSPDEQKIVANKLSRLPPTAEELKGKIHRVDASLDSDVWSFEATDKLRVILYLDGARCVRVHVGRHDPAYNWAKNNRAEVHSRTRVLQVYALPNAAGGLKQNGAAAQRDGLQTSNEAARSVRRRKPKQNTRAAECRPFSMLTDGDLLSIGVPEPWISIIRAAADSDFLRIMNDLPDEAAEKLDDFRRTGVLKKPPPSRADPFDHPDSLRRLHRLGTADTLEAALAYPLERWAVFLHPDQRGLVERTFDGPARVSGGAGTGKTIVAIHRAKRHAEENANARVLVTTHSETLAGYLKDKLRVLLQGNPEAEARIAVESFENVARQLFEGVHKREPPIGDAETVRRLLVSAAAEHGLPGEAGFLAAEWRDIIDARQIKTRDGYVAASRKGRRTGIGKAQKERYWPVFARVWDGLETQGLLTSAGVFQVLAGHYAARKKKPFAHVIVDEAQDLNLAQLRFMAAIAPKAANALFFAGDLGQRIYQQPFSWRGGGVDITGRAVVLKVNYRTSRQIREAADGLLPGILRDEDEWREERRDGVSKFEGPEPRIESFETQEREIAAVAAYLRETAASGVAPGEIGVFVRNRDALSRARAAVEAAGLASAQIEALADGAVSAVRAGSMHLAKGLEFKAVAVMACDAGLLPLAARMAEAEDEAERDDVRARERQLLYVACTRARDRLLVTGVDPVSDFLYDL